MTERDQKMKKDEGKVRMELIPPEFMFALAAVLTKGAEKYEDRLWEQGMSWSRVFGSFMRHMWAWFGGKLPTSHNWLLGDLDPEWEFSHLWHAACCLVFLVAYDYRRIGEDDRPTMPEGMEEPPEITPLRRAPATTNMAPLDVGKKMTLYEVRYRREDTVDAEYSMFYEMEELQNAKHAHHLEESGNLDKGFIVWEIWRVEMDRPDCPCKTYPNCEHGARACLDATRQEKITPQDIWPEGSLGHTFEHHGDGT